MDELAKLGRDDILVIAGTPGILNVRLVVHHLDPEQQLLPDLCTGP